MGIENNNNHSDLLPIAGLSMTGMLVINAYKFAILDFTNIAPEKLSAITLGLAFIAAIAVLSYIAMLVTPSSATNANKKTKEEVVIHKDTLEEILFSLIKSLTPVKEEEVKVISSKEELSDSQIDKKPEPKETINLDEVMKLIKQTLPKVDIDTQDELGNSFMHYAVQTNCDDLVKYIIARNVNPTLKNAEGKTAEELLQERSVAEKKNKNINHMQMLLKGYCYEMPDPEMAAGEDEFGGYRSKQAARPTFRSQVK